MKKHNDADYESWLKRRKQKDTPHEFRKWFAYYHEGMELLDILSGQFYQVRDYLRKVIEAGTRLEMDTKRLDLRMSVLEIAISHDVKILKEVLNEQQKEIDFDGEAIDELYCRLDEIA